MSAGRQITTSSPSTYDPSTDVLQGNRSGGNLIPITIPEATESQTGLMSASDKAALNAAAPQSTTYTKTEDDALLAAKADLVGGKIPVDQIPSIALNEYLGAVADEAAMLALSGQEGDWCTRTDEAAMYSIIGDPTTTAGWLKISHTTIHEADVVDLVSDLAAKAALDASNITASTWLTALGIGQHIAASGSITITDGSGFSQFTWGGVVDDGDSQLVTLSTTLSDGDYRVQLYNDDGTELASCDYYIYSRTATTFRVMAAKPATYKYEVILS